MVTVMYCALTRDALCDVEVVVLRGVVCSSSCTVVWMTKLAVHAMNHVRVIAFWEHAVDTDLVNRSM